ncbi:MAG TPA: hypothetical protein VF538_04615 [Pyrinomonadaceae bacterium]
MTAEKFARFLAWLSPDAERAGEEYERLRSLLCMLFARRGCRFPDELADETINRVILKVGEERIENKLAYCYGVAKNVFRESLRKERTHLDVNGLQIAAEAPAEPSFPEECLDKCLAELPPESRDMILDYFSKDKGEKIRLHQRMAKSFGMTQTALRMRLCRMKSALKNCIRQCSEPQNADT